jgi:UDP-N-acetylmuramyl pentapeptide phosphotransferase/UDP-N-acetylglucosamine-1-phosphate transferase
MPCFQPVAWLSAASGQVRNCLFDVNVALGGLPLAAGLLAAAAIAALLRWRVHLPLAVRNARSLHTVPIPRIGGVAIWAGFVPIACIAPASAMLAIGVWGVPWLLLAGVSLLDDIRGVAIARRLSFHALASAWFAVALAATAETSVPVTFAVFAALVAAWSLNLYNFMDGNDGLAALMTVIGFAAYGVVSLHAGVASTLPWALTAATLPMLAVNWPPARLFLGDVGAVPLGFLAAAFGIGGVIDGAWPAWFPLLVFLSFVADATVTLARRALRGERFWEGHKTHYYQRLHQLGAGHRGTLAIYGALMLGTAGTAVGCACLRPDWGVPALVAWCLVCGMLFAAIDYHWRRKA